MNYGDLPYVAGLHPYIDYVYEDKSNYPRANTKGYIDTWNDWLIGDSDGFLMNIDFIFINTSVFSKIARDYEANRKYCPYPKNSKQYKEFWNNETSLRRLGMTANCKLYQKDIDEYLNPNTTESRREQLLQPLHITGDHYNYLNYGRIVRTPTPSERKEMDRIGDKRETITGFPRFWDGDYWNFKFDEFLAKNHFHGCKAKARRKGYSFKRGSQGANTINLNPGVTIVMAGYDISFLTDPGATSDMIKTNLDWYENHTYWRRAYLSEALDAIELGYKKQREGNKKYGFRSKCLSVTLRNNPGAPIGKGALEVDYEEAGKCNNLKRSLALVQSVTESGALSVGTIRVYGTAGDAESDWVDFSAIFYNPRGNKMMPLENVWDNDARYELCGFFHPQILNYEPYLDEHGNSYLIRAFYADKEDKLWAEKNKDTSEYLMYVGQRANSPNEAFTIGKENIFSSATLVEHYKNVLVNSDFKAYRDGMPVAGEKGIEFKTNAQLKEDGFKIHPYVENVPFKKEDDIYGCFREYYPPIMQDGVVPANTYYATIDPIGKDKNIKEITVKNSLNVIQVWMYPNNIVNTTGDILCCQYAGRFGESSETSDLLKLICLRYNCRALPEVDRGTVVADFRRAHALHLLHRDPTSIVNEKQKENINAPYGINIGGGTRADDGLVLFQQFLYTKCGVDENDVPKYLLHYITDVPMLKELLSFTKNGNFDRISAARVAMYQRLAYRTRGLKPQTPGPKKTLLGTINLYGSLHK